MPYKEKELSPEALLGVMKKGCIYAPYTLGRMFGASAADVKKMMLGMVERGELSTLRPHKSLCFIVKGTEHLRKQAPKKPHLDPATIAQPRTYAVLTGEISGYDAEITRRQQLCMIARPR